MGMLTASRARSAVGQTVNLTSIDQPSPATLETSADPLYFQSGDYSLFGWLHRPARRAAANVGIVICKPFGFEAMSGHLSISAFAATAAEAGIPALRFDYVGTGDSDDMDEGRDQIAAWVEDILAAVRELQRLTGVEHVCLLGFRLGALLAVLAASRCESVTALIAVAPVISGERFLRELRNFERAAARFAADRLVAAPGGPAGAGRDAARVAGGDLEISGFSLSAATVASLSQVDLITRSTPAVAELLVIDRSELPGARAWADSVSARGVRTEYQALAGFPLMMMAAPNLIVVAHSMVAAARHWLERLASATAPRPEPGGMPFTGRNINPSTAVLTVRDGSAAPPSEHPVFLSASPRLFGIITEPPPGETVRGGVVLLNSGGDYHIGPRRMYVSLARRWARRGYVVLRMDLAGLGDSDTRPGREPNEVFPPAAIDDIRTGVEFVRTHFGTADITLGGVCSGASHALRAAVDGIAINRILMVNPLTFFWEEGISFDDVQPWEVVHKPAEYLGRALSMESWRRLLEGDVSLLRVLKIYLTRPRLAVQSWIRDMARRLHIRLKNDVGRELQQLAARGIRIVFVFSRGDAGIGLLQLETGLSAKKLGERYRMRTIDDADHNFTRSAPRAQLQEVLSEELFAGRR